MEGYLFNEGLFKKHMNIKSPSNIDLELSKKGLERAEELYKKLMSTGKYRDAKSSDLTPFKKNKFQI